MTPLVIMHAKKVTIKSAPKECVTDNSPPTVATYCQMESEDLQIKPTPRCSTTPALKAN